MGAYLNSQTPYTLYQSESRSPYFVDKTMLLQELFPMWLQESPSLRHKAAQIWKNNCGQYDQLVFSEGY